MENVPPIMPTLSFFPTPKQTILEFFQHLDYRIVDINKMEIIMKICITDTNTTQHEYRHKDIYNI